MSGLQHNLKARSQYHYGNAVVHFNSKASRADQTSAEEILKSHGFVFSKEYVIELLLRQNDKIAPLILHGVEFDAFVPPFLRGKDLSQLVLGAEVSEKLGMGLDGKMQLISPVHTNAFLGDVPRSIAADLSAIVLTEVSELDGFHGWIRLSAVQNLIREKAINQLRIFYTDDEQEIPTALLERIPGIRVELWEEKMQTLVWSLNLETSVMLSLFIGMGLLVAISLTSGFLLFFDKIKKDLMSFWILGMERSRVIRLLAFQGQVLTIGSTLLGVVFGLLFLWFLQTQGQNLMPSVFVERSIPVMISFRGLLLSFGIPYLVAAIFFFFCLRFFQKENQSFLKLLRDYNSL